MISLEIQVYAFSALRVVRAYRGEIDKTTYYSVEIKHRPFERDNPLLMLGSFVMIEPERRLVV